MAVFICCADESTDGRQQTDFFYGGFAAPEATWEHDFAPAWRERVLNGPPKLDHLHVSEIRRADWRSVRGVTLRDANYRLDEASRVIGSTGALVPIICHMTQSRFRRDVLPFAPTNRHSALEAPDYLAFLSFSYATLLWLKTYRPEVERVDFWAEGNGKTSTYIGRLHDLVAGNLAELGRTDLAQLVGEFKRVPKTCIPAQAADMVCWHERNAKNNTLDTDGWRRRFRMTHDREGYRTDVDEHLLDDFSEALRSTFSPVRAAVVEEIVGLLGERQ